MTLRDYFASTALNGLLSHGVQRNETGDVAQSNWYANAAYQIADAMLAERAK
jgi:RNA-binding protein YlmH